MCIGHYCACRDFEIALLTAAGTVSYPCGCLLLLTSLCLTVAVDIYSFVDMLCFVQLTSQYADLYGRQQSYELVGQAQSVCSLPSPDRSYIN